MSSGPSPSKASLSASKVAELKVLCSKHGLPVSGNKGELVNRLLTYYECAQTSLTPRATPSKDLTSSTASFATIDPIPTKPTTTTISQAVPVQAQKTVQPTLQSSTPAMNNHKDDHPNPQATSTANESKSGTIEDEIEKRKQRAQRFGLAVPSTPAKQPNDEEELKKSNRAKRFGITAPVDMNLEALDRPLADGKDGRVVVKSVADLEWEARKRKRAEKFGLVDNPPSSKHNDRRKSQKFNNHPSRY